jgi:hypothetical protein
VRRLDPHHADLLGGQGDAEVEDLTDPRHSRDRRLWQDMGGDQITGRNLLGQPQPGVVTIDLAGAAAPVTATQECDRRVGRLRWLRDGW